jgi:hypothetical protein
MLNLVMGWRSSLIDQPASQIQSLYGAIKVSMVHIFVMCHELISSMWMLQSGILLVLGGSSWYVLALLWISDGLMLLWYHEQRRELQTIMTSYIFCQLTQIWFVNLMIFSYTRKVRTKAIRHIHGSSMACHLHHISKRTSVPAIMLWLGGWAAHESTLSDKGINLFSAGLFSSQPFVSSLKHGIPRVYFQATFSKKSRWDKKR